MAVGEESGDFCNFMKIFRSVKIMHDNIHRIDFTYLAELFHFMGIFVCEDILVEKERIETEAEENTDYDALIYVGSRNPGEKELAFLSMDREDYAKLMGTITDAYFFYEETAEFLPVYGRGKRVFPEPVYRSCSPEKQIPLLLHMLKGLLKDPGQRNAVEAGELDRLIEIYVRNNLVLHSMNMQYFSRRPSQIIKESRNALRAAHDEIGGQLEAISDGVRLYYEYARLWCEVKINSACDYLKEMFDFFIDRVAGRCQELVGRYPDFTNAKILLGLSYEPSISNANEALDAYFAALEDIDGECFASPVYYWMGKRYETYSRNRKDAELSFKIANEKKEKFRNYFKLAVFAKDKKDYSKAIKLFQKIVKKLEMKKSLAYLDPLELEYIFKSYSQQCYCFYQQEKYTEAIKVGHKVEEFWEDIKEGKYDYYFSNFYGTRLPKWVKGVKKPPGEAFYTRYRNTLLDRLNRAAVYLILSDGYRKMLDTEKADEYKERAAELKRLSGYESEKGELLWGGQMRKSKLY